ncbi:MAG: hypothetical protein AAF525_01310 [Pseudomonadota bacterium]
MYNLFCHRRLCRISGISGVLLLLTAGCAIPLDPAALERATPADIHHSGRPLVSLLEFPSNVGEGNVLVQCKVWVDGLGDYYFPLCYMLEGEKVRYVREVLDKIETAKAIPARIGEESPSVKVMFSVLFDVTHQNIVVFSSHRIATGLIAPQRIAGTARCDVEVVDEYIAYTVSPEGEVVSVSVLGEDLSEQRRSQLRRCVERTKYIPATVDGVRVTADMEERIASGWNTRLFRSRLYGPSLRFWDTNHSIVCVRMSLPGC